jgi:hypothetical protein
MLKLTANCNYFVGFASVGATSMQENRTPIPSFLLPKINWKKESLLSKEVYATFLLWKETLMCRTNLGTIPCNFLHQTEKHDFDKFTLTSNEITGCRQNLEIIWNVYMQEPVNLGNTGPVWMTPAGALPKRGCANYLALVLAAAGLPAVGGENEPHDQKIGIDPIIWC